MVKTKLLEEKKNQQINSRQARDIRVVRVRALSSELEGFSQNLPYNLNYKKKVGVHK